MAMWKINKTFPSKAIIFTKIEMEIEIENESWRLKNFFHFHSLEMKIFSCHKLYSISLNTPFFPHFSREKNFVYGLRFSSFIYFSFHFFLASAFRSTKLRNTSISPSLFVLWYIHFMYVILHIFSIYHFEMREVKSFFPQKWLFPVCLYRIHRNFILFFAFLLPTFPLLS